MSVASWCNVPVGTRTPSGRSEHPLHLSSRPPGVGTRQRAQDRTGIRRRCARTCAAALRRGAPVAFTAVTFTAVIRYPICSNARSHRSLGTQWRSRAQPVLVCVSQRRLSRLARAWAVASQLGSLALARPRWLFTSSIRFFTPCIPSSPAKAAGGRSRAANSNNSPPPCVPVADSRAQLAMGGQERFRRAGCQSESGGLPFLAVAGSTRASLLTPQFGQVLLKAVCGPLRARLMSNTWSDVRRRPWSPRTADHALHLLLLSV